ncbi:MBL fold metallo-hydrolase [Pseudomonas cichorii]|nr:MBL fold metallo-hydrolase [Pseudomonas cichorii]MBX8489802.1 MBL fold metallo-hydrolase [Pseudomonas cichorii]MBX8508214.1 MBL fold metallo-hydrolase [Pseudomonas cichorii]MBX8519137.1 MBL fold metallo-hydrolase [Pseudomonas cichorii]MBX8526171.1 MBL fold metallo-hydrolase [Pseudomonas cichorii]MBX8568085.1 MBL fold metallo-hydrolase [Pseudomonas cichorii]
MLPLFARRFVASIALLGFAGTSLAAQPLKLDVYNPGAEAIFPVSSVLVTAEKDAILVDAQFGKPQAEQVVEKIRKSGKNLTTIYISHGDPDYYFGLQTITEAYPKAKVVASAETVAHIKETMEGKLAYWGPKLGDGAPGKLIVPEVIQGNHLKLEGQELQIVGLDGPQPDRTFVWVPSIKAVIGGVVLANNIHVWMADTQSTKSHQDWLATLATIEKLKPVTIVPGHFLSGELKSEQAPAFTANYIKTFDAETAKAKDSAALIKAMKAHYPKLGEESSLELSAKVAKGEMKW